jgi:hypothetical protein
MKNFRISILLVAAVFSVVALALVIGMNVHGTAPVHGQSLAWGPLPPPDDDFTAVAWGPLPPPDDNFIAWGPLPPPDDGFLSA